MSGCRLQHERGLCQSGIRKSWRKHLPQNTFLFFYQNLLKSVCSKITRLLIELIKQSNCERFIIMLIIHNSLRTGLFHIQTASIRPLLSGPTQIHFQNMSAITACLKVINASENTSSCTSNWRTNKQKPDTDYILPPICGIQYFQGWEQLFSIIEKWNVSF